MSDLMMRIAPWVRDVVLAYAGGLVIGAPIAALVAYATGIERLTTWCLLMAMALVLRTLRQQRQATPVARATAAPLRAAQPRAGHAA